jgi:hypothetical protein
MVMYKFNFKDKVPQKISKWHLIKFVLYAIVLTVLILLIFKKISQFN